MPITKVNIMGTGSFLSAKIIFWTLLVIGIFADIQQGKTDY
jgi:hypothetical protein